jgi:dihydrofolate synthase/folylpolyglutamate synthase
VCDCPLVSIITSISREHWQQLGPTLADIAREKAGILKPGCPAVVAPVPPEALAVITQRIAELGCPAIFPEPARNLGDGWAEYQGCENFQLNPKSFIQNPKSIKYPLPLPGDIQLTNSALAIAALQILTD